jgi:hypothetical protein
MDQIVYGGTPVRSVPDYLDLHQLYGELLTARKTAPDLATRTYLQAQADAVARDIEATKRDPAMAAQITDWWLSRYPKGGRP